ncbi:redox-regulated ATPase YchF [Candidatus Woesearchaeota archaeon]|nr:redox-regulated ATPase YchF [Candidatus Woesearchaeota archaeon]
MIIGVVGKANVGKSTFFKAATLAEVEIANYPFATIAPNHGVGHVKVKSVAQEFNKIPNPREGFYIDGWRFVPVKMIDVAGLVPGAHEGKGMGNQFLNDLNQADALIHVIDVSGSTNEKGEPVQPLSYDPAKDIEFLEVELDMWYLGILKKGWEKFARRVVQEKQDIAKALDKLLSGLGATEDLIKNTIKELNLDPMPTKWTDEQIKQLATILRKITKPMIIACNKIDIPNADKNFERLKKQFPDRIMVACSAESELALREAHKNQMIKYIPGEKKFEITHEEKLNEKQRSALDYIKKNVLDKFNSTGVQEVLDKAVFELLEYKAIFPGGVGKLEDKDGNVIPDCFLMPKDATALDFAFRIHTDIGNKFVKAIDVRKRLPVGKDHILKHRDIIEIMTS